MLYIIYGYFSGPVTELSSVSDTACSIELTFLLFGSTWKMFTKLFYREEGEALLVFGCKALWDIFQDFTERFVPSVEKYIRPSWASFQRRVESPAF